MTGLAHRHSTEALDNAISSGHSKFVVSKDIFDKAYRVKAEFVLDESLEDGAWRVG